MGKLHLVMAVACIAVAAIAPSHGSVNTTTSTQAKQPNVIIILADDIGYSDIGAFGGEIKTPAIDSLAANGKKFTQFYNTARCCPTRASIMTGLYPHQAGVGHLIHKTGHIGYGDHLTSDTVTLPEALKTAGYCTYMAGKWHLAPRSYDPAKDVEHWPTSRGFDKFYGTIAGSGSFWDPSTLCRGTTYITPENDPEYKPEKFYYTDAITDNAIMFLDGHDKQSDEKPFFLYMAYTAPHWPLHAPEESIAEYEGKYDQGYEPIHAARARRLKEMGLIPEVGDYTPPVGDWDKIENKKVEARLMETYAAMITRMDEGIGKVVGHLRETGELDNTLIVYLQDNGGCAEDWFGKPRDIDGPAEPMKPDEIQKRAQPFHTRDGEIVRMGHDVMAGPPDTFTAYKENWANVSNSPFRLYKHYVHEGGISTPLIAHWPAGIKATSETQVIREPAHLIDLMPTVLELAGAEQPQQRQGVNTQTLEGISLVPVLTGNGEIQRDEPIFFEHEGNRAVREDKWKIVAVSEEGPWELYDMTVDRAETNDLAEQHPDVVKELAAKWDAWAERARVLPYGGWRDREGNPAPGRATKLQLKQGDSRARNQSLALKDKGVSITAEILSGPLEGVIVAQGASVNGFTLYAQDDHLTFEVTGRKARDNYIGTIKMPVADLPDAPFTVTATSDDNGRARITVGGKTVTRKAFKPVADDPAQGISVGLDSETPVGKYPEEFTFEGKLGAVTVETLPAE